MQRDEALEELRQIAEDKDHAGGAIWRDTARWALDRIAELEAALDWIAQNVYTTSETAVEEKAKEGRAK